MNKTALLMGSFLTVIALSVTNTASWLILHGEEVPEELK